MLKRSKIQFCMFWHIFHNFAAYRLSIIGRLNSKFFTTRHFSKKVPFWGCLNIRIGWFEKVGVTLYRLFLFEFSKSVKFIKIWWILFDLFTNRLNITEITVKPQIRFHPAYAIFAITGKLLVLEQLFLQKSYINVGFPVVLSTKWAL